MQKKLLIAYNQYASKENLPAVDSSAENLELCSFKDKKTFQNFRLQYNAEKETLVLVLEPNFILAKLPYETKKLISNLESYWEEDFIKFATKMMEQLKKTVVFNWKYTPKDIVGICEEQYYSIGIDSKVFDKFDEKQRERYIKWAINNEIFNPEDIMNFPKAIYVPHDWNSKRIKTYIKETFKCDAQI